LLICAANCGMQQTQPWLRLLRARRYTAQGDANDGRCTGTNI
jgi:hypothetical protein